jgi:PHD/YefM family antitoxin component YafN of YafNO toxin-antitoxin module
LKTLELRNAQKPLAEYTADLDSESIVITSNRKPVAALVSVKGIDRESLALSLSPDFAKIIRRARSEAKRGEVFSLDEVKRELLETAPNTTLQPTSRARRKSKSKKVFARLAAEREAGGQIRIPERSANQHAVKFCIAP